MQDLFSKLNLFFPFATMGLSDVIQILILFFVFYWSTKSLRKTRAWIIVKGLFIVFIIYLTMKLFSFNAVAYLFEKLVGITMTAIVIMFQPELRKMLEKLGKNGLFSTKTFKNLFFLNSKKEKIEESWFFEKTISEITKAAFEMSKTKTGALIVLEKAIPLDEWSNTGINLNSTISWQLLLNIFEHNTPLHDGAIIIENNEIKAATCYLPLSENTTIDKSLGTRHRAGIGITECTDAIVIIVSEETGSVSYVENGQIQHDISQGKLLELLFATKSKKRKLHKNKNIENEKETLKIEEDKTTKKEKLTLFEKIKLNISLKEKIKKYLKNKKHSKKITSLSFLKIISMFMAVIIWFITINIDNEIATHTFKNIPVDIINEEILENTGYSYAIEQGGNIDVTITTRRSILETINKDSFSIIADFKELSLINSIPIHVDIIHKEKDFIEIKEISYNNMIINIENTITKEIPIEIELYGKEQDGHKAVVENHIQTIRVTGPESIISILDKAKGLIDVSNKHEDFTVIPTLAIYDRNGSVVNTNKLSINIDENTPSHLGNSSHKIEVFVNLYEINYVPISILEPNCPDNSICITTEMKASAEEVPIVGNEEKIKEFEKLELQASLNNNLTIDWAYKLPEGIYKGCENSSINISSNTKVYERTTFTIPTNSIKIKGLKDENESLLFKDEYITFSVYLDKNEQSITPEKLEPTIDVSSINSKIIKDEKLINETFYSVVSLKLRETEGVFVKDEETLNVQIIKRKDNM